MTKDEALKLALDDLIAEYHMETSSFAKRVDEIFKQALAAPTVQEPFGYLFQHEETGLTMVVDVQQVEWGFEKNNPRHQKIGPVYTTPPAAQRQWVGLTDRDAGEVIDYVHTNSRYGHHHTGFWMDFYRAIEAKLKEKNT